MLSSDRRNFIAQTGKYLLLFMTTTWAQAQAGGNSKSKPSGKDVSPAAIEKKVRAIIADHLGVDEKKVTLKARFVEDLGADSLDMVELVMAFEEAFDISVPDEDIPKIHTVQDAVDYIAKHVKAGSQS